MADEKFPVIGRLSRFLKRIFGPFSSGKGDRKWVGVGAGLGLLIGVVIGAVTDNVGLGVALGLVFGAGGGSAASRKGKDHGED